MTREPIKQGPGTPRPKLPRRSGKLSVTANKRVAEQTRKILGKHYANKYRVR